jgi:hypothetical protein
MEKPLAARRPLFSGRTLVWAAVVAETVLLLCLWATTVAREWSLPVVASLSCATILGVFVFGEMMRRRFQVSVTVMMALVFLVAIICAMLGHRLNQAISQRREMAAVTRAGGTVGYDYMVIGGWTKTKGGWMFPNWLTSFCGSDLFARVRVVGFGNGTFNDARFKKFDIETLREVPSLFFNMSPVGDGSLAHLAPLGHLTSLSLGQTKVTDAGLRHLVGLTQLRELWLHSTAITDAGLPHLYNLSQLRVLTLSKQVTPQGVAELQRALPDCKIYH